MTQGLLNYSYIRDLEAAVKELKAQVAILEEKVSDQDKKIEQLERTTGLHPTCDPY